MTERFALIGSALMLLLAACAILQGGSAEPSAGFDFALIGDIPYDAKHEREFANVMKDIDSTKGPSNNECGKRNRESRSATGGVR
jgi:hypothetical protein